MYIYIYMCVNKVTKEVGQKHVTCISHENFFSFIECWRNTGTMNANNTKAHTLNNQINRPISDQ